MLNLCCWLSIFRVISVDVIARDKESKETVDDGDYTILNVIDFLLADLARELGYS